MSQDNPGASDAELVARDELAHALMYFGRGMPVIYYGDEQGFTGDGGDQDARQDMMPSLVASYNDDDLIGTTATTADDNFDDTHPLYQTLADFGALLAAHPALTRGRPAPSLQRGRGGHLRVQPHRADREGRVRRRAEQQRVGRLGFLRHRLAVDDVHRAVARWRSGDHLRRRRAI